MARLATNGHEAAMAGILDGPQGGEKPHDWKNCGNILEVNVGHRIALAFYASATDRHVGGTVFQLSVCDASLHPVSNITLERAQGL